MRSWRTIRGYALLPALFFCSVVCASPAAPADSTAKSVTDTSSVRLTEENTLSIAAIVLPHHSLKNSKTLHSWPFFAFAVPSWAYNAKAQWNSRFFSLKGLVASDVNFTGLGVRVDATAELLRLLELGVQANTETAINYGETATFMGVYDPEKRDYRRNIVFSEYAYGLRYHGALTVPLLALLPKTDWTKIILKGSAELTYSAYTGAEDREVWKVGNENRVNGFKYKYGGTLIYMLPFARVPLAMVSANVSGFKHESDFDEVYRDYNPGFKTVKVTPMVSFKLNGIWNGMLMASFSRDRVFENRRYPSTEELLQKQVGSEWDLRTIMCIFSRRF